uniref:NACHT domain-containing protein n=1 Tax=Neogobius melanostomus TaxID=47308 RepID=A0A8C6T067_9GOBI
MDQTSPGSDPDSKDWGLGLKRRKLETPGSTTRRKSRSKPSSVPSCESLRSKALSIDFKRNSEPPDLSCQSMEKDRSKEWGDDFKRRKLETPGSATRRKHGSRPSSRPSCESLRSKALSIDFKRNSDPPGLSCQSMQSNESKEWGVNFKRKKMEKLGFIITKKSRLRPSCESLRSKALSIDFKRDLDTPGSGLSCRSMQSDKSKEWGIGFCDATLEDTEEESCPELSDPHLRDIFMSLEKDILTFVQEQLRRLYKVLASDYPEYLGHEEEDPSTEAFLNITVDFLKRRKQEPLAERLHSLSPRVCRDELKRFLQPKFSCVSEGIAKAGNPTLLNQIYTELHITEGGAAEVNQEHEVRHIEAASRKPAAPETTMKSEDLFKGHKQAEETTERQGPIRTVLTKGVAGVGKTVLTQKFSLDWAEGRANQDIQLLFPFTFRQLNVLRDRQFSLVGLLQHFFSETKSLCGLNHQVLFILDGLDECRLPLDFSRTRVLTDPTESVSLEVLLVNLIRGNLLPSARLWITTRPAAANQIPAECVSMVTEVRGFSDSQKEEYFRKRFRDEQQATAMISHIKKSRSLFIMCHLPVFSWMLTTVLHHVMETEVKEQLPQTMTEMYIHFLVVQAKVKNVKYDGRSVTDPHWSPETRRMVESLGKLAFEQLQKGNLIFYESDMSECGLDAADASVYSGVFTQVFREEPGLYQDKVFCFIHLSVQEFLAALHVHLTFFNSGVNLMSEYEPWYKKKSESESKKESQMIFYESAVNMALKSPNGHLDLFLRFLMGLSLSTNQRLLSGLQTQTGSSSLTNVETAKHIKEKLDGDDDLSAEQRMNLLHCLNELNDHSLVEQVQQSMREGRLSDKYLSSSEWSAVAFLVLSSDSDLEEFDLRKYDPSEEALNGLLPLAKAATRVM